LFPKNSSTDIVPGSLNDDSLVRETITESIKRSGKTRERIAEEMTRTLGLPVTARMITSFTTKSKELHRWPGAWDRAFCAAVGDNSLLFCCLERAGFRAINEAEADLLELGREYLKQERANDQVALLKKRLQGFDL
jgi:hypothetical protein